MTSILRLIKKYHNKSISESEKNALVAWIGRHKDNRLLFEQLTRTGPLLDELKKLYRVDKEAGWQTIINKMNR